MVVKFSELDFCKHGGKVEKVGVISVKKLSFGFPQDLSQILIAYSSCGCKAITQINNTQTKNKQRSVLVIFNRSTIL